MAVLDPARLPEPPRPLAPDVRLVRNDGTPTAEYHQYMARVFEWQRLLRTLLTEEPVRSRQWHP